MRRILLPLLVAIVWPTAAAAQEAGRFELSAGAGVGNVTRGEGGGSDASPAVNVGLGVSLGSSLRLTLEGALFGTRDEEPRTSDLRVTGTPPITDVEVVRRPRIFETMTVLASVEIPIGARFYVRPAIGGGRHAFASYHVGATEVEAAEVSHEWGPAAGAAVGRTFGRGSLRVAVEGAALWTGGEDSSSDRTILALRVVPRLSL